MISILIPVYNYNVVALVEELQTQALNCNIPFEILAYDDGSTSILNENNKIINKLKHCVFKELPENIGRCKIRNLLGRDARYDNLLFVDAGTFPNDKNFIKAYLGALKSQVTVGGMTHLNSAPGKPFNLRWLYTKKRESIIKNDDGFCSSNFMVTKEILDSYPFDESIKSYGCEDVLFFHNLKANKISITSISNPVIHDAKDDATTFIKKTESAMKNLSTLIDEKKLPIDAFNISYIYHYLQKWKLVKFTAFLYFRLKILMLRNFNSSRPSILLFDFYRLGYYCSHKRKK